MKLAIVLLFGLLIANPLQAAEKIPPKSFKNVDQAVGWVKAKGECSGDDMRICRVAVELPKKYEGKELSPGWQLEGEMLSIEVKTTSYLRVRIYRTRQFNISPKDSAATMSVMRTSQYETGSHGKWLTGDRSIEVTNYKGETLFKVNNRNPRLTLPDAANDELDNFSENLDLMKAGFGLDFWIWDSK